MSGQMQGDPPPGTPTGVRTALVRLAVARGRVAQTMAAAVHSGQSRPELESLAYEMLASTDGEIRRMGAASLGQLARVHRDIDRERALTALRGLLLDPAMGTAAGEALGDVLNNT